MQTQNEQAAFEKAKERKTLITSLTKGPLKHYRRPLADTFDSESPKTSAHELAGSHKKSIITGYDRLGG